MQRTGQTGGGKTRLSFCGIRLAMTTANEWSPHRAVRIWVRTHVIATRPSVDVQSVPVLSQLQFMAKQKCRLSGKKAECEKTNYRA
jgi:hypothetical protein